MRLRRRYLTAVAVLGGLGGGAVAIMPALATAGPAASSEVKLEVNENCYLTSWPCWNVVGNPPKDNPALGEIKPFTIAPGGTISFEGKEFDNGGVHSTDVIWKGARPSCTPEVPSSPQTTWNSTCTFAEAGEYDFESPGLFDADGVNYTQYKVIVGEPTSTTTSSTMTTTSSSSTSSTMTKASSSTTSSTMTTTVPTATRTSTTTTSTTTMPAATAATRSAGGSTEKTSGATKARPPAGLAKLALASAQRGDAVHGTVQIPAADGGARLEVELLARGAAPAKVKRGKSSRVGRLVRSSAPAGTASFTVSLDAQAKRVLRSSHKLALTVKIVLTPKHGTAMTLTRSVVVR